MLLSIGVLFIRLLLAMAKYLMIRTDSLRGFISIVGYIVSQLRILLNKLIFELDWSCFDTKKDSLHLVGWKSSSPVG